MDKYDSKAKWTYTFTLLLLTAIYAVLSQFIFQSKAGDILLGALIGWNTLTTQYFFRKAAPEVPDTIAPTVAIPPVEPVPPVK